MSAAIDLRFTRATERTEKLLTSRWHSMRWHAEQERLIKSRARFKVVPAGRRSGKTERAKRRLVRACLSANVYCDPRYFAAAPTRDQAKRIYWKDLKALTPEWAIQDKSESDLMIKFWSGAELWVLGMDKPERAEGQPWNGGVLDEYANMKPQTWSDHIRPAMTDRRGWVWFTGVPEGRNHYYDLYEQARKLKASGDNDWDTFHWVTADIQSAEEIAKAQRDMDELSYQQEYEASFVNFQGRAYYPFSEHLHCAPLTYNPRAPLIFMFDFNVAPGVACVGQEMTLPNGNEGFGIIGEVWIPQNSNTERVCHRLVKDWHTHQGDVFAYGDFTGGARGTAKLSGSDWDIIKRIMREVYTDRFAPKIRANPSERSRVNAVNARLRSIDNVVRLMVDPAKAPHVVRDFEGVRLLEGGSGR